MTKVLSAVAAILLGNAILMMGIGLFGTLVSIGLVQAGFSTLMVGLVQSAYYAGFMIGALGASALIARIGHHRAFAVFASVLCCAALGHAVFSQAWVWATLRLIAGFCMVGLFTVVESWLHAAVSNKHRGRVFSFYLITAYLAAGVGQLLLKLADPASFKLFSLIACLFALSLLPVTLTDKRAAPQEPGEAGPVAGLRLSALLQLYRQAPLGVWGGLAAGMLNSGFYAMAPVFMRGVGYSVAGVSSFMGAAMLAALCLQWPVGRLSDRIDRRRVLFGVATLATASCIAITWYRQGIWLEPMVYLYVSLTFTVYGLVTSYINDFIANDQLIAASAGLLLLFSVGGMLGPTIASLVMTTLGPVGYFVFSGGVTCVLALLTLRLLLQKIPAAANPFSA
ncbi:MFS transporter [Vogesella sp. LIG4]|uniref:MFS transporter n=1 Tax=Vogesella sp. LIG4 TaxID=1192162 RepID=UPI00081F85EF|nr:MFS transporter [Vogesella sp. LIG4]SCK14640.1 Predicted arabinose efflux permease, MFS family [Vogesella sp. LIG4]